MSSSSNCVQYSEYSQENTDDLEQALVLAAADADARQNEENQTYLEKTTPQVVDENALLLLELQNPITTTAHQNNNHKSRAARKADDDEAEEVQSPPKKVRPNEQSSSIAKKVCTEPAQEGYAKVVACHYNSLEEKGLDERSKSRIVYLRNFHNWIKSMLINEYISKVKETKKHNSPLRVSDMCCGKGGDLLKWRKASITHLICSDIASVSLDQCKSRYNDMKNRNFRDRSNTGNLYSIEYIPADCTRQRLREKYSDPSMKLDLVSCQFAFHYSFESLPQAECMIRNASECLQPGGFFIGTIPDSNDIIARARKENSNTFGNDIYTVTVDCDINKPPLFGGKYNFQLDGVVDCPEFLVHFQTFVKLAKKYGLKLINKEKFYTFYERMKHEGKQLLTNMRSLETYPPNEGTSLNGTARNDYAHAEEYLQNEKLDNVKMGTLSKSEWEASSLYLTFAFVKVKNTWNADGTPCFDI